LIEDKGIFMGSAPPQAATSQEQQMCVFDQQGMFKVWLDTMIEQKNLTFQQAQSAWKKHGPQLVKGATSEEFKSWFPNIKDVAQGGALLFKLARDVGIKGKYYIREYKGRQYIIFKGNPAVRKYLTGTRYGLNHAKMINLQIGRVGMRTAIRGSFVFSMIFCTVINVADYVARDNATLGELFGATAVDLGKTLIATGAAFAVAGIAAAAAGTAMIAIGPIIAAVVVSVAVAVILDEIDKKYKIQEKLSKMIDAGLVKLEKVARELKKEGEQAWHDFQTSKIVVDLSRDAYSISEDFLRGVNYVRWKISSYF
jgi:Ca2+/Na+ antiporter